MARRPSSSLRIFADIVRPLSRLFTKRVWRGAEHLRRTDGFVVAANHVTNVDPLTTGHFLYSNGVPPRFLVKDSLFKVPVLRTILSASQQIPVSRGTSDASLALDAAIEAVRDGEAIFVFPEGTHTRDPGLWPMLGHLGAARIALTTGCEVIPIAQWGTHEMLASHSKRLRLLPRTQVSIITGPPVDLSDLRDQPLNKATFVEATSRIMWTIARQLAEVRGEQPPASLYDPRSQTRGNNKERQV